MSTMSRLRQLNESLVQIERRCILDAIHTNFMDANKDSKFLLVWMEELLNKYPDLEVW